MKFKLKSTDIQAISRKLSIHTMVIFYGWFITIIHGHSKRIFYQVDDYSYYKLSESFDSPKYPEHKKKIDDDIEIFFDILRD